MRGSGVESIATLPPYEDMKTKIKGITAYIDTCKSGFKAVTEYGVFIAPNLKDLISLVTDTVSLFARAN